MDLEQRVAALEAGTTPPPPPPPPPSGTVYFDGNFDAGNVLRWPDLHDCPQSERSNVTNGVWRCRTSSTISSGTGGGPANFIAYTVDAPWERPGQLTFYRFKLLYPSGSNPTYPGQMIPPTSNSQNNVLEWHNTSIGSYSTSFGFNASGAASNSFWLQVHGGDTNIARQWFWDKQADNSTPIPVKFDTWGEIVAEVFWTHQGSIGLSPGYFKLWVDWGSGRRQICPPASGKDVYGNPWPLNRPTLWRRSDGSYDPVWLETGQYRWTGSGGSPPVTQETSVYLDEWKIGDSLAAVGG